MNVTMIENPMTAIRFALRRLEKAYVLAHNREDNVQTETQCLEALALVERAIVLTRRVDF